MTEPQTSTGAPRRVARNAGILLARQLFVTAVGVVVTAMVARHLGKTDFGRFEYAFTLVLAFSALGDCGLRAVTVRTVAQEGHPLTSYLGLMLSLRLVLACAVWPLAIIAAYYLADSRTLVILVAIAALTLPVNAVGTTLRDVLQGLERFDVEAAASVAVRMATLVGAMAVIALDHGVLAIASVYAGGTLFGLLIPVIAMRRAGYELRFRWSMPEAFRELRLALPFAANALVGLLLWEINPLLIEALSSMAMVGIFAAGARLLMPLHMISESVSDALTPAVARAWVDGGARSAGDLIGRAFYALLVIGLPIAVGGALCADELVTLVFGADFEEAAEVLFILAVVLPLELISVPANDVLGAIHQQNRLLWITSGSAAVNVTLSLVLIPRMGAVGCAWAVAAATLFFCAAALGLLWRHCRPWLPGGAYARLLLANGIMALAVHLALPLGVLFAVPVGVVVYSVAALGLGAVSLGMLRELFRRPQPEMEELE